MTEGRADCFCKGGRSLGTEGGPGLELPPPKGGLETTRRNCYHRRPFLGSTFGYGADVAVLQAGECGERGSAAKNPNALRRDRRGHVAF